MNVTALVKPLRKLGPESIREFVFGVEDGVVQNMALIAGMVGASLSNSIIVLAGAVNGIAGVLSMAMGTYLSSGAERDAVIAAGEEKAILRSPRRDAAVMAAAYAGGALVPLISFALLSRAAALVVAMLLTAATLFGLGVASAVVGHKRRLRSGLQLMTLAAAAGLAGYLVGAFAQAVFGFDA